MCSTGVRGLYPSTSHDPLKKPSQLGVWLYRGKKGGIEGGNASAGEKGLRVERDIMPWGGGGKKTGVKDSLQNENLKKNRPGKGRNKRAGKSIMIFRGGGGGVEVTARMGEAD